MMSQASGSLIAPLWMVAGGLLVLPILEIAAFVWVAGKIGILAALVALVATSFLGLSLLRRQGGEAFWRLSSALRRGERPEGAARESLMVALGGALMILPGFVTDAIGFLLLLPSMLGSWGRPAPAPVRETVRPRPPNPDARVIDLEAGEWSRVDGGGPPPR